MNISEKNGKLSFFSYLKLLFLSRSYS